MINAALKLVFLVICAVSSVSAACADSSSNVLIDSYFSAYNAHDVDEMLTLVTDDIRWMYVDGDQVYVEAAGKDSLGVAMVAHFARSPTTRSEVRELSRLGNFVAVTEAAMRESDGAVHSQCAISVYQISEGLISNVWYYAAQPCERIAD